MIQIDPRAPPMFLIVRRPPFAVAQDEDVFLTVAVAAPTLPDEVETIDIYLTAEFAKLMIDQLSAAVEVAAKEAARQVGEWRTGQLASTVIKPAASLENGVSAIGRAKPGITAMS
jgi:hypothetical protein